MPRTKGSKNKAKALTIDEQIIAAEARMEELMAAMAASGKSVSDVIALIKGGDSK